VTSSKVSHRTWFFVVLWFKVSKEGILDAGLFNLREKSIGVEVMSDQLVACDGDPLAGVFPAVLARSACCQTLSYRGVDLLEFFGRFGERLVREFVPVFVLKDQALDVRFCGQTFGAGPLSGLSFQIR